MEPNADFDERSELLFDEGDVNALRPTPRQVLSSSIESTTIFFGDCLGSLDRTVASVAKDENAKGDVSASRCGKSETAALTASQTRTA